MSVSHTALRFPLRWRKGGYIHENGEYTKENTLVLTLIGAKSEVIEDIARDLCAFFHQESVLVTEGEIRTYFIKETLG